MTKSKFINLLKNNRTARGVAFQLLFGILIGIFLLIIVEDILYLTLGIVSQSSNSMFHNNLSFDEYWDEQGKLFSFFDISKEEFKSFPFSNGFTNKDGFIAHKNSKRIKEGDIIVFESNDRFLVHRVIYIWKDSTLSTKGDGNFGFLKEEINISSDQVVSEVIFRIPYFSYLVWKFKPETNLS
ncbi:S26 family signal peptidase [Candidatus Woesearchaeota archaeon]|nr:S26 family signal peptidase [Candidatus Woesearchaeota archaeon]